MNGIKSKKLLNIVAVFLVAGFTVLLSPIAFAGSRNDRNNNDMSGSKPKITGVVERTNNSVVLSFKDKKFKNKTVDVIVTIKRKSPKVLFERVFKVSVNENGKGTVAVDKLMSGVKYKFKIRILKAGGEKSTRNSNEKSVFTK